MSSMELRKIEEAKAHCAREHFRAISGENGYMMVERLIGCGNWCRVVCGSSTNAIRACCLLVLNY